MLSYNPNRRTASTYKKQNIPQHTSMQTDHGHNNPLCLQTSNLTTNITWDRDFFFKSILSMAVSLPTLKWEKISTCPAGPASWSPRPPSSRTFLSRGCGCLQSFCAHRTWLSWSRPCGLADGNNYDNDNGDDVMEVMVVVRAILTWPCLCTGKSVVSLKAIIGGRNRDSSRELSENNREWVLPWQGTWRYALGAPRGSTLRCSQREVDRVVLFRGLTRRQFRRCCCPGRLLWCAH